MAKSVEASSSSKSPNRMRLAVISSPRSGANGGWCQSGGVSMTVDSMLARQASRPLNALDRPGDSVAPLPGAFRMPLMPRLAYVSIP